MSHPSVWARAVPPVLHTPSCRDSPEPASRPPDALPDATLHPGLLHNRVLVAGRQEASSPRPQRVPCSGTTPTQFPRECRELIRVNTSGRKGKDWARRHQRTALQEDCPQVGPCGAKKPGVYTPTTLVPRIWIRAPWEGCEPGSLPVGQTTELTPEQPGDLAPRIRAAGSSERGQAVEQALTQQTAPEKPLQALQIHRAETKPVSREG